MGTTIAAPASCEVCAVIRFLHAEGQSAAEIHRRLCRVYGDNFMSDICVRKWCRKFRDGRTNVHDVGGQGRPSIVTDELVQKVDQCVRGKRLFTISELSEEFPQTSRTALYRIVTDRLGYHKLCARWLPKQLTDFHKTQRIGSALTFLQLYREEGDEFLDRIVTDELVHKVDQCVRGKRRLTISELSEEFPQTSRTTLYRIVTDRLGYRKFCARWVPKQLTDFHKTQRMGSQP
jgi:transposase